MGGVRVPFRRPSQLKPSYHLNIKGSHFTHGTWSTLFLTLLCVTSLTCASGCPSLHFSGFPASQMDYLCGHKDVQLKMSSAGFCKCASKSLEIVYSTSCILSFWFVLIPIYLEVCVVPEVGFDWCVRAAWNNTCYSTDKIITSTH